MKLKHVQQKSCITYYRYLNNRKYLSLQLLLSAIFSVIYALTMVVTLIFLVKEAVESGYCSTTVIFFAFVAGVFVIAAIIHPQVEQKITGN